MARHLILIFILFFTVSIRVSWGQVSASASGSSSYHSSRASALLDKIKKENKVVDAFDPNLTYTLPIGVSKTLGNSEFIIAIDSMWFEPSGGTLSVYMSMEVPGSEQKLAFRGANIKFDEKGIKSGSKLMLVSDVPISISNGHKLTIKGDKGLTFVNFDCDGYQGMSLDIELELPRSLVVPEDEKGNRIEDENQKVKSRFMVQMASWGELMASITLPPFQVTKLKDFGFRVDEAYFDFSDVANPPSIVFPEGYTSGQLTEPGSPLWEGVFIKNVSVRLPSKFSKKGNKPTSFYATDVIIDDMGLSGNFGAKNLINIDSGSISSWAFSLESIELKLQANQLKKASLDGKIKIPIVANPLGYKAVIQDEDDYLFTISSFSTVTIPLWVARAELAPNSSITIESKGGKFLPKANLYGKVSITPGGSVKASLMDISFENLQIQTVSPKVKADFFGVSINSDRKMSNFPVSIEDIGLIFKNEDVGVKFTVKVKFVGESAGFAGDAGLIVWGEPADNGGIAGYKYKTIDLTSVKIAIDGGAFKIRGELITYKEDPVYGNGFKGMVDAEFVKIEVKATAQFGNVNNFRYWYADAMVKFHPGIPVFTGFGLYGFGGGAYHHMTRQVANAKPLPADAASSPTDNSPNSGASLSGITYVPDIKSFFGIKATVIVGTHPSPEAFNGDATFEVTFNDQWGVRKIGFLGNAYFMSQPGEGNTSAAVRASLLIDYDLENSILFGNMEVFVNVAGVIKGMGPNNRAGQMTMFFSPGDWYIYIGKPDPIEQRIGLEFISLFQVTSYMVMGTDVPGMPPPPPEVSDILGGIDNSRDELALRKGAGFGFGASLRFDTGDKHFLMFYARLRAGAGFDVLLKNYGNDVHCEGSSSAIGINGWYAQGQVYAYFQGTIGIKVDLTFYKGNFDIIDVGAAAILQAKLPNPVWMRGIIGGHYSILGGLVEGNCRFEMEIGKQCKIAGGSPLTGIKVISECSPAEGESAIDVFNAPQATFNIAVDKVFELSDMDGEKKAFRVQLDYFKLFEGQNEIKGYLEWNPEKNVVAFNPTDILPGKKTIKIQIRAFFQERVNGNWVNVMVSGKTVDEIYTSSFQSGDEPTSIPHHNVAYSYPSISQYNFYPKESNRGYIQLKQGQPNLFNLTSEWKQVLRYSSSGVKRETPLSYDNESKRISFTQPEGLANDKIHTFQIVNVPVGMVAKVDNNVTAKVDTKESSNGNTVSIRREDIEGTLNLLQEKSIFDAHFRASKFNTLKEKIAALTIQKPAASWPFTPAIIRQIIIMRGNELFDASEVTNDFNNSGTVRLEADMNNNWFNTHAGPLIYNGYPNQDLYINWGGRNDVSIPPVRAIGVEPITLEPEKLTESDITAGSVNLTQNMVKFYYDINYFASKDAENLRDQAANSSLRYNSSWMNRIMTTPLMGIFQGDYDVKFHYYLPGTFTPNSTSNITFTR